MSYLKDRYINFFTDFGFKRLFGSEASKQCLIDFLNSLFEGMEEPIKELQFRNTEHLGASELDRKAIFDLYCESESGEKFIVELQKAKQKFFKDRSLFYSTFPIQEQAKKGGWDFKLKAVYTVGILDFEFDDDISEPDKYLYTVKLSDIDTHKVFHDKLTFVYLEMPKFKKNRSELITHQDKWLYALKNLQDLENVPENFTEEVFKEFFHVAEIAKLSRDDLAAYEHSLKYYRDMNNVIDTAREEARDEVREEMQEQIEEERRQKEEERRQKEVLVQALKASGKSDDEINALLK